MQHMLAPLGRALRNALLGTLALALAACAGALRISPTPEPAGIAPSVVVATSTPAPTQLLQVTPTSLAIDCTPTVGQLEPGEVIILLSRVTGCPGLVRVEWRTAILLVPVELLGLSEADLAGLPEEVR